MSRHYHDDDCVPAALESLVDRLDELLKVLERIAERLPEPDPEYSDPAS